MSKDPWEGDESKSQTQNGWGYVNGNPTNLTDKTGRLPDCQDQSGHPCGFPGPGKRWVELAEEFTLTSYYTFRESLYPWWKTSEAAIMIFRNGRYETKRWTRNDPLPVNEPYRLVAREVSSQ